MLSLSFSFLACCLNRFWLNLSSSSLLWLNSSSRLIVSTQHSWLVFRLPNIDKQSVIIKCFQLLAGRLTCVSEGGFGAVWETKHDLGVFGYFWSPVLQSAPPRCHRLDFFILISKTFSHVSNIIPTPNPLSSVFRVERGLVFVVTTEENMMSHSRGCKAEKKEVMWRSLADLFSQCGSWVVLVLLTLVPPDSTVLQRASFA